MRQPSEHTTLLIKDLHAIMANRSWFGFGKSERHATIAELLNQIAGQKELATVGLFANYLFDDSQAIQLRAKQAIDVILSSTKPTELFNMMDQGICIYSNEWRKLRKSQVASIVSDEVTRVSLLGLLSYNPSGFVRQEAVRRLGLNQDGRELVYLLIRMNDWVKPIRDDARSLVINRITDKYVPEILHCLGVIARLLNCHRDDHTPIVRQVVELLLRPEHNATLQVAINLPDASVRRILFKTAFNLGIAHDRIVPMGLNSSDPVIRLKASKAVALFASGGALRSIARRLQQDTFMPVRREGYLIEAGAYPGELDQIWSRGLLDKNASIRDYARFYLAKANTLNVTDYYRKLAMSTPLTVAIALGLGETGDECNLPFLRGTMSAASSATLTSALIRSLSALAKEAAVPDLLLFLNDHRPSVIRETCLQLKKYARHIPPEELYHAIANNQPTHARNALLQLLAQLGKWTSLPWLIRLLNNSDESLVQASMSKITAWFTAPLCNRIFTKPSQHESEDIQAAINGCISQHNLPFLQQLKRWLKET